MTDLQLQMKTREIKQVVKGQAAFDGDRVKLTRLIGGREVDMVDPFLMLDRFESNQAKDHIGGVVQCGSSVLQPTELGVVGNGDAEIINAEVESRFLLTAGKSLNEPVARCGPFVMNTQAEIQQAFKDFKNGRF